MIETRLQPKKDTEATEDTRPEFKAGDSVLVTGTVPQAGQCGTILGFMRHLTPILYVVIFDKGNWADLTAKNLIGPIEV